MGAYGITGWSGGGRRPITYNLAAGQFRGMGRVNVFPSQTTIINNNIIGGGGGCYQDVSCCSGGNSTPKWANWMMGIGLSTSLLGNILSAFGGSGSAEGAGDAGNTKEQPKADNSEINEKLDKLTKQNEKMQKQIKEMLKMREASKAYEAEKQKEEKPSQTLDDISLTKVRDFKLGAKADIQGSVKKNADGSYSITTNNNIFTYKDAGRQVEYTVNGKTYKCSVYTCSKATDLQGNPKAITSQEYILFNGELIQPSELNLAGTGTGTIKKQ